MGIDDGGGGSRIFAGYRPLGYVSNDIPCITRWVAGNKIHFVPARKPRPLGKFVNIAL